MTCHEADQFIEAMAMGEPSADLLRTHAAGCARCAARLALAQRIEQTLASRPVAQVPASFTLGVMARLRRERWRAEQVVDLGFNLAVGIGVVLIIGGFAGLAWSAGLISLIRDIATAVFGATRAAATRMTADVHVMTVAMLLISMAAALWWWAEEDLSV